MPRDAVSRTANVERNGGHKWVKVVNIDHQLSAQAVASILQVQHPKQHGKNLVYRNVWRSP